MANNCIVGIRITTANETAGTLFYDRLTAAKHKADLEQRGIFIGCPTRYLFDAQFFRDRDTVQIFGWVKWGFSNEEVKTFIRWLEQHAGIKDFRMDYDECGCLLYGTYSYSDGKLVKRYLPEEDYPELDEISEPGAELESALQKHGISVELPME